MPLTISIRTSQPSGLSEHSAVVANLATTFRRIAATRMAGLPILHPALEVEAVGFRPWQEGSIGVLITPWFMNLIFLTGEGVDWPHQASGTVSTRILPTGEYRFLTAMEEGIGPYLSSSLFSPMAEFANMAAAREVATAVMAELFLPPADQGDPPGGLSQRLAAPVSRRGFLAALLPREHR